MSRKPSNLNTTPTTPSKSMAHPPPCPPRSDLRDCVKFGTSPTQGRPGVGTASAVASSLGVCAYLFAYCAHILLPNWNLEFGLRLPWHVGAGPLSLKVGGSCCLEGICCFRNAVRSTAVPQETNLTGIHNPLTYIQQYNLQTDY